MKIPSLNKMVRVEWIDSHVSHDWQYEDLIEDIPRCITVGTLRYKCDDFIRVDFTYSESGARLESLRIPVGCIENIKEVK
jgi:hypothetical protein